MFLEKLKEIFKKELFFTDERYVEKYVHVEHVKFDFVPRCTLLDKIIAIQTRKNRGDPTRVDALNLQLPVCSAILSAVFSIRPSYFKIRFRVEESVRPNTWDS